MKKDLLFYFITLFYSFVLLLFSVYSYSQIDLNLTLSSNSLYQKFQNSMIQLGYFNRPLSFWIFVSLIICLFSCYIYFLKLSWDKKLSNGKIIFLIIISAVILFFSYPAFSSDIFNYIFDARIVTKYHVNPYQYKALDFSSDLWLRFMRWTHRTYPYGPFWLILTVPLSLLGIEKFVPSLMLFKLSFLGVHLGNTFLIYKIVKQKKSELAVFSSLFYGLNPLILIESVASPHNDSVMLFFVLLSFYWMNKKKNVLSLGSLFLSGAIKFSTWILTPLFIFKIFRRNLVYFSSLIMIIPLIVQIFNREAYPWYFIPILGIISLFTDYFYLQVAAIAFSFIAIFQYAPYLLLGVYTPQVAQIKSYIFYIPLIVIIFCLFLYRFVGDKIHIWKKK